MQGKLIAVVYTLRTYLTSCKDLREYIEGLTKTLNFG